MPILSVQTTFIFLRNTKKKSRGAGGYNDVEIDGHNDGERYTEVQRQKDGGTSKHTQTRTKAQRATTRRKETTNRNGEHGPTVNSNAKYSSKDKFGTESDPEALYKTRQLC